jgi:hypothetical protein
VQFYAGASESVLLTGGAVREFLGELRCSARNDGGTHSPVESSNTKWPIKAYMEEYMKNLWTMIVLAGLVALVAAMPAVAQNTWNGDELNVSFTAPMPFYAADTKMPAGAYHIKQNVGVDSSMLVVKADRGKHEVLVPFEAIESPKPVKNIDVTFNKYGNDEYLNSIAYGSISNTQGRWILKIKPTAAEQAAAKAAAATPHKVSGSNTPK